MSWLRRWWDRLRRGPQLREMRALMATQAERLREVATRAEQAERNAKGLEGDVRCASCGTVSWSWTLPALGREAGGAQLPDVRARAPATGDRQVTTDSSLPRWWSAFFACIRRGTTLTVACQRAPVSRTYVNRLRRSDTPLGRRFRSEMDEAQRVYRETEARRAVLGLG